MGLEGEFDVFFVAEDDDGLGVHFHGGLLLEEAVELGGDEGLLFHRGINDYR